MDRLGGDGSSVLDLPTGRTHDTHVVIWETDIVR